MGYRIWDPKARKIVCSNDLFFNEDKMHKKPIKTVKIRRFVFQEDGHVHRGVQNARQVGQNSPHVQEEVRGDEEAIGLNLLSDGLVELVEHLIDMLLL